MKRNKNPSASDELLAGGGPDKITFETPACLAKRMQCPRYGEGCETIAVCWMEPDREN